MKPAHIKLRVDMDGRIWATHEQPTKPIRRLRDMTDDILLCLCADLSADDANREIQRSVQFSDGRRVVVSVRLEGDGE